MRALICAFGSHGDVLPLVAIGAELKRRGHDVVVGSAEPFGAAVRRAGLEFEQLATEAEYREALAHADLWRPIRGARRLLGFVERSIRPVHDFVARRRLKGETMAIASSLAIGARVANDALSVPLITVHLSPMMMQSGHEAPRLPGLPPLAWLPPRFRWDLQMGVDEYFVDPAVTPRLNAFRAELGLKPIKRLRHWWNAPRRMLLMWPDWFAAPQADWPGQARLGGFPRADLFGHVDDRPDEALEAFFAAGETPIAVTFGSAMRGGEELYRAALDACERLERRCLVLSPTPVEIRPAMRGRAIVVPYAPFGAVLPRCAAFVHHGGVGTLAQGFAAGLPQLVVPLAFDQFDNADRLHRLGCGISVSRRWFGPRSGARALAALISSPAVAESCRQVSELMRADDAVGRACDEIEAEFAAERAIRRARPKRKAQRPPTAAD
ncbi:glycosyltransferase [Hansschlegelia zhihuaiae]|uniref:Glycosyltransferase n=1 Tax=Hansschlegelia zhihuaiae TaxID=405005 RepID=A0A4Q0MMG1_9HYPH|nr:nucleotide disphospho-sugar-binding domain-containing protein [Hansschlegelia zhihuaiae]RXF74940.1 glycosyltransferase [Hansschlegelia zhihuaiae]